MKRSFIYLFILLFLPAVLHAQSQPQYRVSGIKKEIFTNPGWQVSDSVKLYYSNGRPGYIDWKWAKTASRSQNLSSTLMIGKVNPGLCYDSLFLAYGYQKQFKRRLLQEFDPQSNIIKVVNYDSTSALKQFTLNQTAEYTYNGGKLSETKYTNISPASWTHTTYRYKNGLLDSILTYEPKSMTSLYTVDVFYYNAGGLLVNTTRHSIYNGNTTMKVYEYDMNARLTKISDLFANFDTLQTIEYTYNAAGDMTEEYVESYKNFPWEKSEYTYDGNHNVIEEVISQGRDPLTPGLDTFAKRSYTYNAQSLLTKMDVKQWVNSQWIYAVDTSYPTRSQILSIEYEIYWPTSVAQTSVKEPTVKLYPSPSSDFIRIEAVWKEEKPFEAMITDMQGRVIRQWQEPANRFYTRTIPIPELPAGVYIIRMQCGDESFSRQFVKQ